MWCFLREQLCLPFSASEFVTRELLMNRYLLCASFTFLPQRLRVYCELSAIWALLYSLGVYMDCLWPLKMPLLLPNLKGPWNNLLCHSKMLPVLAKLLFKVKTYLSPLLKGPVCSWSYRASIFPLPYFYPHDSDLKCLPPLLPWANSHLSMKELHPPWPPSMYFPFPWTSRAPIISISYLVAECVPIVTFPPWTI